MYSVFDRVVTFVKCFDRELSHEMGGWRVFWAEKILGVAIYEANGVSPICSLCCTSFESAPIHEMNGVSPLCPLCCSSFESVRYDGLWSRGVLRGLGWRFEVFRVSNFPR